MPTIMQGRDARNELHYNWTARTIILIWISHGLPQIGQLNVVMKT